MSGIQQIIAHIEEDTAREQTGVLQNAETQSKRLLDEAAARADAADAQAEAETARKVALLRATADSAAHKDGKNLLLTTRRALIERAFDEALASLRGLSGKALYDALQSIVVKNAQPGEGRLILSETDAAGLPTGFVASCNAGIVDGSVTLSDERRVTGGGVILQYGPIEINCTFAEMLSAAREQLEDEVSRVLFA